MPTSNEALKEILKNNPIDGVDFDDGLKRFGGQVSIYVRIVKSFIASTPETLELLSTCGSDGHEDYTIRVHGLKGSCYGISATPHGDEAKALEMAAKGDDWVCVKRDTPQLIERVKLLISDLEALVTKLDADKESGNDIRPRTDTPDKQVLRRLLSATKSFDIEAIRQSIADLDTVKYDKYPDLVDELNRNLTNFRYDLIEDKVGELLEESA
ncbi:MAG TPA: hypothetical protein DEB24_03325 [Coriobacteriia bacterium]|nr:hypothetical protein [Coriobacteriia bacterium]